MRFASSSAGRSATWVHVALAAQVLAMAALVIFERFEGGRLARELALFGGDPRSPGAEAIVRPVTLFAVLVLAVAATTVAAMAAYLLWLRRVLRKVRGGAVWVWLIPAVNLIAPPFAVHAAWDAAGPPERRRTRWVMLLASWWISWLTALTLIVVRLLQHSPRQLTGLGVTELAVISLAAALCAATVREITQLRGIRRAAPAWPYLTQVRGLRSTARHSYPAGQ
jgi:hypothetical protein